MMLSILEYMNYLGGSEYSKCVVEGENVINAGHLILAGKTEGNTEHVTIYGLCLQSSSLDSLPHEITGELSVGTAVSIKKMLCSCKAGNSGRCKHVSAFLIKCIREDIESLEVVSSTDRKCVWSVQKHITKDKYRPLPVDAMPCFQNKKRVVDMVVDGDEVRNFFSQKLSNSAIAKHRKGRREEPIYSYATETNICHNDFFVQILNNACQSPLMMCLASVNVTAQRECCVQLLDNLKNDDTGVVINIPQHSDDWKKIRKYRITGSRSYEIYTYSKNNWKKKALKYFNPPSLNNKYIKHGLLYENRARDVFSKISKMEVVECGMVISEANKWLGYSPDGIIFFDHQPQYLLEIKCVFQGKTETISDAVKNVKYVVLENGEYKMKKQHKYYGQIQMGMAVLNLPKTYFVVYASYDDSILVISVDFDYKFTFNMLEQVKHNYFKNMLHEVCNK